MIGRSIGCRSIAISTFVGIQSTLKRVLPSDIVGFTSLNAFKRSIAVLLRACRTKYLKREMLQTLCK